MALLILGLFDQPPGFFDLTLPTTLGQWVVLLIFCGVMGIGCHVWTRRLLQPLHRLPPRRERRRLFLLGMGGILLGAGSFWVCLTWWLLWKFTIDSWNQAHHQAVAVPSSNLFDYTWWLWWLAFGMGAIGKVLYSQAKDQAHRLVSRLEGQEVS